MDRRQSVLRSLLDPLHRRSEAAGQRNGEQLLGVHVEFGAEATSDVRGDHAQLRLGDPECRGGQQPQDVGHLGRRPEGDVSAGLEPGDDTTRFDRVRNQRRLDISVLHDHVRTVVERARLELPHVRDVRAEAVVHERRSLRCGRLDVDEHGQRLVVDLDELGGIDRVSARVGQDDRDAVALVVDLIDREREVLGILHVLGHRPRTGHRCLPVVAKLRAREDCDDAGAVLRGGRVDRRDAGVRIRAADDRHEDHPVQLDVVDVRASAAKERIVLLALERRADEPRLGRGHDPTPAAAATASTMLWYPVHRQRLPSSPLLIAARSPASPLSINETAAITIPGVQ